MTCGKEKFYSTPFVNKLLLLLLKGQIFQKIISLFSSVIFQWVKSFNKSEKVFVYSSPFRRRLHKVFTKGHIYCIPRQIKPNLK